ncbi:MULTISPECIES: hypothetical protein [unclassified Rhodococcus (in: high G+C Gram-positive bacteria)]|uniref:hypothetical protein n=1 Tax=unclassified Rhodococcus (in: high G+C Gram-positive bacteria) TaxID=192944 RepID=UPI0006F623EB|nr:MULTISPECIES: hypothetical protein [unclassified Rhodococcus (in: high G+C Gram-positive bacteria)]KQU28252.1 hypothetical protein ASG69_09485 [Rhodococcus sp. Leaf225]KQU46361.1 hypothetical protein ASH03_06520 [Rhodococcus sp. Leaf258]
MSDDREKMLTDHHRPDGSDDATVSAVGSVSEALEWVERARGHLYTFHQLMGHADLQFGSAADELRDAGHGDAADALEREVIGRNVIEGRWTFQMVEDFDDGYWTTAREHERRIRDDLMDGRRHVFEAEMKENRRTHGKRGHEATP